MTNKYYRYIQLQKARLICLAFCVIGISGCSTESEPIPADTLSQYLYQKNYLQGAVIACAASDTSGQHLWTFFYPETGATDIRLYESDGLDIDPTALENYTWQKEETEPVFNGYLRRYNTTPTTDKWLIVSLVLRDTIRVSHPIRSRMFSKQTDWKGTVSIDQSIAGLPTFGWVDNSTGDNAIYFQVVSDSSRNLLSGTYTFENNFTYYDLSNVVLNVTTSMPPSLLPNATYGFTLMDVSEDNWVNLVAEDIFKAK